MTNPDSTSRLAVVRPAGVPRLPDDLQAGLYLPTDNSDVAVTIVRNGLGRSPVDYSATIITSRTQYDEYYMSTRYGLADARRRIPCTRIYTNDDGTVYLFYRQSPSNSTDVLSSKGYPAPGSLHHMQITIPRESANLGTYFMRITSTQRIVDQSNRVLGMDSQPVIAVPCVAFLYAGAGV
jgi:hypothetical protein